MFILKNLTFVYIVIFFATPTILRTLLSSDDVDCDLIEWQSEDDSPEEDCFDDFVHLFSNQFIMENVDAMENPLLKDIFSAHSDYDPDILIPPPRSI